MSDQVTLCSHLMKIDPFGSEGLLLINPPVPLGKVCNAVYWWFYACACAAHVWCLRRTLLALMA